MSIRIGLQLYSVRQSLGADFWGTLEEVAEAGCKVIEAANHNAVTDPKVVKLEIDTYGMYRGGQDPVNWMERKEPLCFVEIGNAASMIRRIIDAAATLPNLEYMILEQDHPRLGELESIRESRHAFDESFTGIGWD